MASRATMRTVTVREFGDELRRRRDAKDISRPKLGKMSGVSADTFSKWEDKKNPPKHPNRANVINVARALKWDPDEAFTLLGYPPMSDDERRFTRPPADPWEELQRLWPRLSGPQQHVIVNLVVVILEPQRPAVEDAERPKRVPAGDGSGSASRSVKHIIDTPSGSTRTVDGYNGDDYAAGLNEPS